jgi:hypothetical protein
MIPLLDLLFESEIDRAQHSPAIWTLWSIDLDVMHVLRFYYDK